MIVLALSVIVNSLAIIGIQVQVRSLRRAARPAGICGASQPLPPFTPAIARGVCNLPAGHTGWHRADQPGGMRIDWESRP